MFYEDAGLPEQITVTEDVLKNSGTLIVSRGLSNLHQVREALVTHFVRNTRAMKRKRSRTTRTCSTRAAPRRS
jgi:hypothetical protein